jgi:hypothetical protein
MQLLDYPSPSSGDDGSQRLQAAVDLILTFDSDMP